MFLQNRLDLFKYVSTDIDNNNISFINTMMMRQVEFFFCRIHLQMHLKKFLIVIHFIELCSKWSNQKYVTVGGSYGLVPTMGPVSLRLMTSQLKDVVTYMQKYKAVKCIFCGVWVQTFVWNFKGDLWNFTQNFKPIYRKICILRGVRQLMISYSYHILSLSETVPWTASH